ncbi:CHAT domain-containing protein [Cronbergia sp. UHCC 0137]|uniref:CHAT domain-containing protein n=1 Tax=Cronbergia sp. UHCC 0137 TaxID=3110239 RepID=UPI002B1F3097|nr:CHAT domain-containing protein [Cronbergia sp. UHCC 0137]MEA5619712.1 CHAT domain-containing protein [Cronbergia sp. UHCC 0137]
MQPRFWFFTILTATVFSFLDVGIAFSENHQVVPDGRKQSDYGEKVEVVPQLNLALQIAKINQTAIIASQQRQFKKALQQLQIALTLSQESELKTEEAMTLNNIGRVYQNQGQYLPALQFYQQAVILNKASGDIVQLGKTYSNIGYLFDIQNKPELAVFFYKHCLLNREKARLNPSVLSLPQPDAYTITVAETYRFLGDKLLQQGRVAEAQRTMDLLKIEELEGYLQNVSGNEGTAKGIAIVAEEKIIKQKLDQTIDGGVVISQELTKLREIPAAQLSSSQKQRLDQLVAEQQKLLDQFNQFITSPAVTAQLEQISRTSKGENLKLNSLQEIQASLAKLPQKSVIIYPLVLPDRLELVVVSPNSPPIHRRVAVTQEKLNQTIALFRQSLGSPIKNAKIPANQLYNWLIKPIENDLKVLGTQTLMYAPDDQLRYIPLAALFDGKQWLIERFSVNNITAASLINLNTPRESSLQVLAGAFSEGSFVVPLGNRRVAFAGLPFAEKEVENLSAKIPQTKKLLNDAFSLKATVPQMENYTIIHLATHAAFAKGKPEDSFILFGNGDRVNLRDVRKWSLPRVDLVVLSACETAVGGILGNGEEILGFGYQIQKTGAKAVIASLWSVDDGGTQILMSAFYRNLLSNQTTKTAALQQAQIALIKGKWQRENNNLPTVVGNNLSHPYYWSPFILIGNGL